MYHTDTVFDTLKRVELVQKLYFEIYHLVNMVHEINRKYKYVPESKLKLIGKKEKVAKGVVTKEPGQFGDQQNYVNPDMPVLSLEGLSYLDQKEVMKQNEKRKKKEKKKRESFMSKLAVIKEQANNRKPIKKIYNKFWPKDYGWEIDYYW
ncbi:unnamed protein product [Diatraea saccharalis]|uniref:Uncharacterized protein n=1 Tax=Diatraea saccharalis TaxID=40085 RepID=A0A9N9R6X9_9NEOP|nr:unnamed protein product [Diatraea saccharalis]